MPPSRASIVPSFVKSFTRHSTSSPRRRWWSGSSAHGTKATRDFRSDSRDGFAAFPFFSKVRLPKRPHIAFVSTIWMVTTSLREMKCLHCWGERVGSWLNSGNFSTDPDLKTFPTIVSFAGTHSLSIRKTTTRTRVLRIWWKSLCESLTSIKMERSRFRIIRRR